MPHPEAWRKVIMVKIRRAKRVFLALIASTVAFVPIAVATSAVAQATTVATTLGSSPDDNGFCGVRVAGPTYAGGGEYTYEINNKCSQGYHFAVYLPDVGRYAIGSKSGTTCQWAPAYSYDYYWAPSPDPNWYIVNC
jgi:hypothetical protein